MEMSLKLKSNVKRLSSITDTADGFSRKAIKTDSYSSAQAPGNDMNLLFRCHNRLRVLLIHRRLLLSWLKYHLQIDKLETLVGSPKMISSKTGEPALQNEIQASNTKTNLNKVNDQTSECPDVHIAGIIADGSLDCSTLTDILQHRLDCCSDKEAGLIADHVKGRLEEFIDTKTDSFLSRTSIHRSEDFFNFLVAYSKKHLKRLAARDYSCRVLRAVLRKSEAVRQLTLKIFSEDFKFCLTNFSSIFLLTEAIRLSKDPGEYSFVADAFSADP